MSKKNAKLKKARRHRAHAPAGGQPMTAIDPIQAGAFESPATQMRQDPAEAAAEVRESASEVGTAAAEAAGDAARAASDVAAEAVDRADIAAERVAEATGAELSGSVDALSQYNAKLVEALRTNVAAATAHATALAQAKSVPEAAAINADHMRRQFEALTGQGRELAVLAQRIALAAMQPLKGIVPRR